VSQEFHLPRVLMLARAHRVDAWGLSAEGDLHGIRPHLRESLACLRAYVDCVGLGAPSRGRRPK
jgi:vancomycin permeability regulator SanA